jgi:predicted transcriptional regulator
LTLTLSRRYRGKFEVYCCLLKLLADGPAKKTHVMNACNLNSTAAKRILDKLVRSGVVKVVRHGREFHYSLTDRGMMALLAANVFMKLVESPPVEKCRKKARESMQSHDVVEGTYLGTDHGLEIPVAFYSPSTKEAILVAEDDSGLTAIYYALARLLSSGVDYLNIVTIYATRPIKNRLEKLFEDSEVIRVRECD